jgi:hypothetical protein
MVVMPKDGQYDRNIRAFIDKTDNLLWLTAAGMSICIRKGLRCFPFIREALYESFLYWRCVKTIRFRIAAATEIFQFVTLSRIIMGSNQPPI